MRKDLTDITIVVDRSGSMSAVKDEAESGVNAFIKEQAAAPGSATLSLVQFDTRYEFVHSAVPIGSVPPYSLIPGGMTALLDAIGRAITETGDRLSKIAEDQRPGLVVFVIMTDGLENSSREFSKAQVKSMIERQTKEYSWQFTYLGANQDAFAEAGSIGIPVEAAANYSEVKTSGVLRAASANVMRMRCAVASDSAVVNEYTSDERKWIT